MAKIHNLSSKLTLNTSNFITGLDKSMAKAKKFTAGVGQVGKKLLTLGSVAGGAAAAGLALVTTRHLAGIDAAAKFADEVGVSTEALMGYRHAADLTGTKQETIDKGLQRLVRRLGEAKLGYGEGVKGLDALGLAAEDMQNKSPEQALALIADRLNQQPDAATKAAAAYALFGRQGQEMLNFLALGSEGLASTREEAEQLGLTFSRVDAAKVEAANDAITRVKAGIAGAGQSLTIALAPYIEATAEQLLGLGLSGDMMSKKIMTGVEWVATGIAKASDIVGYFKAAFYGAQAAVTGGLGLIVKGWGYMGQAVEAVLNLLPGVEIQFSNTLHALGDELIDTAKNAAVKSQQAFDAALSGSSSRQVSAWFDEVNAKADEYAQGIADNAAKALDATRSGFIDNDAIEQDIKNAEEVTKQLADLDKQLERFGLSDIEIKLADLAELGATNEQLEAARQKLEAIARLDRDRERDNQLAGMLDDLESQVSTFGLTDDERTLLDLEALGASADQLERAKRYMEQLAALEDQQEADSEREKKDAERQRLLDARQPQQLTRANSAEAQRLAFQAFRGIQPQKDDTPKRQLDAQTRMAATLERIEQNQQTGDSDEWEL